MDNKTKPTETRLENGINVITTVRMIPPGEATPAQLLKWDKAKQLIYGVQTEIHFKKQETDCQ